MRRTKVMVSHIRQTYEKALNSSNWISSHIRTEMFNKLFNMTIYVGSTGRRSDPEFVEEVYKPYPDAPLDRLFPTWIRALSLCTPNAWTDQTNPLYDESEVNAEYFGDDNIAIVTTALLHDPYLYPYGPLALNYGGLGMLSSSGRQEALNATADSENLADLVGTMISYAAFDSLPAKYKRGTLAGLDMSAEQLFFINTCTKWCAQRSRPTEDYAPYRSRCIVPLMNMPEFSTAFRCAAGSPMNPRKKCAIW
ncbi:hypothetical protein HPB52_014026 [Rhipicephalus sanguineus]|uniref:Peptidase M13 C-terminal domain-containing protein n=1 Tax=Rhipicephalus sanguineus TaxID=34632 RepID=A0A9D4SXE2_RHISA|nr:hypothetical protein HPB52_014026 [Rhipicephalus sanguineus]